MQCGVGGVDRGHRPAALPGAGAAQQPEEERARRQGGEHAQRQVGVGDQRAGAEVGERAARSRPRARCAARSMRWPGPTIMRIRCGTIRPTNRMMPVNATPPRRARRPPRSRCLTQPLHVDAEVTGRGLTEGEQIQLGAIRIAAEDAERRHRRHHRDRAPGGAVEAAELPEHDLIARGGAGDER